jgi:hypothetical protein
VIHTRTTGYLTCPWCGFAEFNCGCRAVTITLRVPEQVWIELDFFESFERLPGPAATTEAKIAFDLPRSATADWTRAHRLPPVRAPPVDASPLSAYYPVDDSQIVPRPHRPGDPDRQPDGVRRHGDVELRHPAVDREGRPMMHFLAGCGFVLLLYVFLAWVKTL